MINYYLLFKAIAGVALLWGLGILLGSILLRLFKINNLAGKIFSLIFSIGGIIYGAVQIRMGRGSLTIFIIVICSLVCCFSVVYEGIEFLKKKKN